LLAIGAVSSACSNGYYVDLAEVRQRHAALAEQQPTLKRVKRPRARAAPAVPESQHEITSSAGPHSHTAMASGNEFKPWPKRGTTEAEQLQAEEIKREQRINEVIHNICRGC